MWSKIAEALNNHPTFWLGTYINTHKNCGALIEGW
jgi:hypothetical protein